MPTWIAFFRGINVGGKTTLPMKELVSHLKAVGCADIRTYIQSGNAVFQSSEGKAESVAKRIASTIQRKSGLNLGVTVLSEKELSKALSENPYPKAQSDPKSLHLYFLAAKPKASAVDSLAELKTKSERYALRNKILYLHTPDGFGKSKLAGRVEKLLGVEATARNWRTVNKVLELAQKAE